MFIIVNKYDESEMKVSSFFMRLMIALNFFRLQPAETFIRSTDRSSGFCDSGHHLALHRWFLRVHVPKRCHRAKGRGSFTTGHIVSSAQRALLSGWNNRNGAFSFSTAFLP